MYNRLPTKTAKRLAITPIGKTISFAIFGLLLLRAANINVRGQAADNFNPNSNGGAADIVTQPDGRVLIGGSSTNIGGQTRNRLARFLGDTVYFILEILRRTFSATLKISATLLRLQFRLRLIIA